MDVFELHAAAFAESQVLTGNCPVFTWDTVDWLMMPNTAMLRKDLSIGGFGPDSDLAFHILLDQFGASGFEDPEDLKAAMLQTEMEYLGHIYKIISVDILAGGLILKIGANDLNQGA